MDRVRRVHVCVRGAALPRAAPARTPPERVARVYTIRWFGEGDARAWQPLAFL